MTTEYVLDERRLRFADGDFARRSSWVYVWMRGDDIIYVGATGLPPAVRAWLHLHDEDPDIGRVRALHPEALTGPVEVRAFQLPTTLDRQGVRRSLMALIADAPRDGDEPTEAEQKAAIEIMGRLRPV